MAHEVENMMYVGNVPWHGLGIKLDAPPTAEEAIVAAGLNWDVELRDIYTPKNLTDTTLFNDSTGSNLLRVPGHRSVVRTSDDSVLGVVGNRWTPLQNKEAFKFFDPFIESGTAEYHTAGSLKGGKRIWVLSKLAGDPLKVAKGDEVEKFLLLSNAHDGTVSVNVRFTPIRVVCNNTLTMAESDDAVPFLKIQHRGNVKNTLDEIQKVMDMTNKTFNITLDQYRFLASKQVSNLDMFVKTVVKPKLVAAAETDEEFGEIKESKAMNQIIELFEGGRGQDIASIKGSYWAAYNAVTEWVDYKRGRDDTRLEKAWFGKGQKIKDHALSTAIELAKTA